MSTIPADPGPHLPPDARSRLRQRGALVTAALVLVAPLAGCSDTGGGGLPDAKQTASGPGAPASIDIPPDVGRSLSRVLARRAQALSGADRDRFVRDLSRSDEEFLAQQTTYFDNLRQLPIAGLRLDLDPRSLVRSGDDYWGSVEVALQLDGYDEAPVMTVDRYRFSPAGAGGGRYVLSSVTDPDWEARNDVLAQPWDTGPVVVRSRPGVLGVFDPRSVRRARPLLGSVRRGISDVAAVVPYEWSRSVVVYALSDTGFLSAIEDPAGGHPEQFDGLTFAVPAAPSGDDVASTRVVLHPRTFDRSRAERDRLVRHELTHVAIGDEDDGAPLWLSEGLAEYVSVRPLAPEDRSLTRAALVAARQGRLKDLPGSETFNADDTSVHYGVSWWACEYLALTFGEGSLWTILEQLDEAGPEASERLESMTGINTRTLARKAAKLMVSTFGTARSMADDRELPSDPSPGASPGPGTGDGEGNAGE